MFRTKPVIFAALLLASVANAQYGAKLNAGATPTTVASSTSGSVTASMPARGHEMVVVKSLERFTHTATLPKGADPASVRFERVKLVRIPTRTRSTADADYCEEAALREPGGSMRCPSIRQEGIARAFEVTYSFEGQPLASDEYGNRSFTFSVYFRPEEFSAKQQEVLLRGKGRASVAEMFQLTTSRELQSREVVDYNHSTFCAGTYVDGLWSRTNPACEDSIKFKTITVPAEYLTVRVEPAPLSRAAASASVY